jgi:phage-related protein
MKRRIITFGRYFGEFMKGLTVKEREKVDYGLVLLKTQDRLPAKFVKHIRDGLYELRTEYNGNIYRVFFIFDEGKIVVLFNGFQKKTQKTPVSEITKSYISRIENGESALAIVTTNYYLHHSIAFKAL